MLVRSLSSNGDQHWTNQPLTEPLSCCLFAACKRHSNVVSSAVFVLFFTFFLFVVSEEEIEEERKKLYDAIGYSEKGKAAAYDKEVCVVSCVYNPHSSSLYSTSLIEQKFLFIEFLLSSKTALTSTVLIIVFMYWLFNILFHSPLSQYRSHCHTVTFHYYHQQTIFKQYWVSDISLTHSITH